MTHVTHVSCLHCFHMAGTIHLGFPFLLPFSTFTVTVCVLVLFCLPPVPCPCGCEPPARLPWHLSPPAALRQPPPHRCHGTAAHKWQWACQPSRQWSSSLLIILWQQDTNFPKKALQEEIDEYGSGRLAHRTKFQHHRVFAVTERWQPHHPLHILVDGEGVRCQGRGPQLSVGLGAGFLMQQMFNQAEWIDGKCSQHVVVSYHWAYHITQSKLALSKAKPRSQVLCLESGKFDLWLLIKSGSIGWGGVGYWSLCSMLRTQGHQIMTSTQLDGWDETDHILSQQVKTIHRFTSPSAGFLGLLGAALAASTFLIYFFTKFRIF